MRMGPSPIGLLGLFVFSISFIALFGYVFGVEVAYGWGTFTRMAIHSSIGLQLLAVILVVLGWSSDSSETIDIHEIWPWMKLYSFVGVLVAAVVSALLGVLLLYSHMQRDSQETFTEIVAEKGHAVDRYVKHIIEITNEISQHPKARDALFAHVAGAITEDELVRKTTTALQDVVSGRPEVRGILRLDRNGRPIVAIGRGIPERFLNQSGRLDNPQNFYGPFWIEDELYLLLTIRIGEEQYLGSDVMLVKADELAALLKPRIGLFGRVKLLLAIYSDESLEIFEFSKKGPKDRTDVLKVAPEISAGLREAFVGHSGLIVPGLVKQSTTLVAYAPVSSVRWAVLARASTARLYGAANNELVNALFVAVLLAIVGSFSLELVFRTFIYRAQKLSADLKTELASRNAAEAALKDTQEEIEKSLREKELLLGEIHHRVKNNLQIVSTIFNLQRRRTDDVAVLNVLQEGQNRIRSIALLHESLYKTGEFSRIDAQAYLGDVVQHAVRSFGADGQVALKVANDKPVYLDIDQAIPCGLIVNELITNAVKHAFPAHSNKQSNEVNVSIAAIDSGEIELRVSDNGVGLPPSFSFEETRTLGSRIITSLSRQLKATLTVEGEGGATFVVLIPPHTVEEKTNG
jgi:two-component sensor histidine kinase